MGRVFTTDGLVVRVYPRGEGDKLIQLLTKDRGRLSVIVRHGQSGRDRLATVSQLFTWGNYEIAESHGALWLRSGAVLSSFYSLSCDLTSMALAAYLCDLAGEVVNAAEPPAPDETEPDEMAQFGERLLRMLLNSLYTLEQGSKPPALVKGVFEMRTAALAGFCPDLDACAHCGDRYPAESYLDVMNGRLICDTCKRRLNRGAIGEPVDEALGERSILLPLTVPTLAAMRCALAAPDKRIFSFAMEPPEAEAFAGATEAFLLNHLERGFDTLQFYHSVAAPMATPADMPRADRGEGGAL